MKLLVPEGLENREHVFRDWIVLASDAADCKKFLCVIWAIWTASGFEVEAIACLQAVILGRDLELKFVDIEGDSLTVIKKA